MAKRALLLLGLSWVAASDQQKLTQRLSHNERSLTSCEEFQCPWECPYTYPDTMEQEGGCVCDQEGMHTCKSDTCHDPVGCNQCHDGYFKNTYTSFCVPCALTGPSCLHCTDFLGCQQCVDGVARIWNADCGLYICDDFCGSTIGSPDPPTAQPTWWPTNKPTTAKPTAWPTAKPTTAKPTSWPTAKPTTAKPTSWPTDKPTTAKPTSWPTGKPTMKPTYWRVMPSGCETAYGYYSDSHGDNTCFSSLGFNNWGWSIGPFFDNDFGSGAVGVIYVDLYAGAGQCDLNKGTVVGQVKLKYKKNSNILEMSFEAFSGYEFDDAHAHAGVEILPRDNQGDFTTAPGQYEHKEDGGGGFTQVTFYDEVDGYTGSGFFVVLHATVCTA